MQLANIQGGGGLPYIGHGGMSYVLPQRVWFLGLFGLKKGIDFAHFSLKLGMVFEGTTGVYESIIYHNDFNSKSTRKK